MRFLSRFSLKAIGATMLICAAPVAMAFQTVGAEAPSVCRTGWPVGATIWDNYRVYAKAVQAMDEERFADAAYLYDCLNRIPDTNLFYSAAIAHLRAGNLPAAEANFRNELFMDPRSARSQLGLGYVYVQQGRRAEAEEMLRTLEQRRERCGSRCERAEEIDRATEVLARALG